jgi:hypothetical protein
MKWTEDDTYKFVGLYRDYECLWNMSSANYKNEHMRQRAIMQAMWILSTPPNQKDKKKWGHLKTCYQRGGK